MSHSQWNTDLNSGHDHIDHHHEEVFQLDSLLMLAIRHNKRTYLDSIIRFLEDYSTDHFSEEESLMDTHNYKGLSEHQQQHQQFKSQVTLLRQVFNDETHTTHLYYMIRRFIDALIHHIKHTDQKMAVFLRTLNE